MTVFMSREPKAMPRVPEPRWPVALALLAAAGLHFVLPRTLVMGPPWMVLGTVSALIAAAWYARHRCWWIWNERLSYAALIVLTAALIFGLGGLLWALPRRLEVASAMLRSAAV